MQSPEQVALYDRLGGVYNIATVVDDFIDRIMVDPRLNANPRVDEAHLSGYKEIPRRSFQYVREHPAGWEGGYLVALSYQVDDRRGAQRHGGHHTGSAWGSGLRPNRPGDHQSRQCQEPE